VHLLLCVCCDCCNLLLGSTLVRDKLLHNALSVIEMHNCCINSHAIDNNQLYAGALLPLKQQFNNTASDASSETVMTCVHDAVVVFAVLCPNTGSAI
jgi:hypothetical protein